MFKLKLLKDPDPLCLRIGTRVKFGTTEYIITGKDENRVYVDNTEKHFRLSNYIEYVKTNQIKIISHVQVEET